MSFATGGLASGVTQPGRGPLRQDAASSTRTTPTCSPPSHETYSGTRIRPLMRGRHEWPFTVVLVTSALVPLCARRLIPATTSVRMLPFNPIPWLLPWATPKNRAESRWEKPCLHDRGEILIGPHFSKSFLKGDIRLRAMQWNDSHPHPSRNPLIWSVTARSLGSALSPSMTLLTFLSSDRVRSPHSYVPRGINLKNNATDFRPVYSTEITHWRIPGLPASSSCSLSPDPSRQE